MVNEVTFTKGSDEERTMLRGALVFYATPTMYVASAIVPGETLVLVDGGEVARKALELSNPSDDTCDLCHGPLDDEGMCVNLQTNSMLCPAGGV